MENAIQPISVHLPEGQNTLQFLTGTAPKQLDNLAPVKININGTIHAPLAFLEKRVKDIDLHKAHVIVNRDELSITLIIAEDDGYNRGTVVGKLEYSKIYKELGINARKVWRPEALAQFLKINRAFFADKCENMSVVSALKKYEGKVEQNIKRGADEKGNRSASFVQDVAESNLPESFKLRLPVFSGGDYVDIEVETYASIDGTDIQIVLQSAGANDVAEDVKANAISDIIAKIEEIAPEIVIIEQ